jgi:hypothetical protein
LHKYLDISTKVLSSDEINVSFKVNYGEKKNIVNQLKMMCPQNESLHHGCTDGAICQSTLLTT